MSIEEHRSNLLTVISQITDRGLAIRHSSPGDLVVVGFEGDKKEQLGELVTLASELKLRVKWCNSDGTLVAIGIPTQKHHGKKGSQQTPESSARLLRRSGQEGRPDEGTNEGERSGEDARGTEAPLGKE